MKRKIIGMATAAALAVSVAACGGSDSSKDESKSDTTAAAEEKSDDAKSDDAKSDDSKSDEGSDEGSADDSAGGEMETGVGVTDDTITIGLNADLSGIFAPLVTQIVDAQEAYWEIVNDNGGIAGRKIELKTLDNAYDVPKHLENHEKLADEDEGVLMIAHSTGSPHTAATSEALAESDLVAIPLSWYSGWPDPAIGQNVMELYTNYCFEGMNGVEYLAGANDAKTIAVVSFPGEYGQDGATGAKKAAEALGLEVVYDGEGAIVPGADQTPIITELVNAKPDIVWATMNPTSLAEIMGGAAAQGLTAKWGGNSPSWNYQLLNTELKPVADELYTHSTYTALWDSNDSEGMKEMIAGMTEKRPDAPLSDIYIVGWTSGMATQALLEKAAENGNLTRAGIVEALGQVEVDFKGLAPTQKWNGEINDIVVRESYLYDIDSSKFTPDATVSQGGGTGFELIEGPYVGTIAKDYKFDKACFSAG